MGSKGSQTTNTSQNSTYVPTGAGYLTNALNAAQTLGQQGAPTIPTAPVAGFSGQQQQGFNLANNTGIQNPFISQAQGLFSPSGINQFYNPAVNSVTAQMQNIFGQQNQQNNANLVQAAGGVGADRIAVGQGNLANQQALAAGQTYSGLWNSAAQQAQSAAYGTAGLGQQAQAANTQDINQLLTSGGLQQQLSQAQLNAPYQQQLAQMALPYQLQQFYGSQIGALAPSLGGTTFGTGTSQSQYNPSLFSSLLGLGSIGLGAFGKGTGGSVGYAGGGAANPFAGFDDGGTIQPPLQITPEIAARFQRRLQNAESDDHIQRIVRDAARYGVDWSHLLAKADGGPIDVSQGLFAGPKLFRLPDQAPQVAPTHVPQINLNTQAPNLSQQGQQGMQGLSALGRLMKGYNNSTSNLFGMSNAAQDALQDAGFLARGGVPNPFSRLPHFDGGGGDGGDGGGSDGDGGGGDGGIGSDAGAMGEGNASGIGGGGIGSDAAAAAATGGLNSEDTDSNESAVAAAMGNQEAGLATAPGAALGNFGTGLGFGLNDTDSVGAFGPGNLNAMSGITGAFDEGIAGFGPGSLTGPNGLGIASLGPGLGVDDAMGQSNVGMNSPFGMTPNQAVAASFADLGTPPGINENLGQVAANTAPSDTSSASLGASLAAAALGALANTGALPGAISSGINSAAGALSGVAQGINTATSAAMTGIGNMQGPTATALGDPTSAPTSPAAQAAIAASLGVSPAALADLGYGGGYGYIPSGYSNPFLQHAARGGAMNPFSRRGYDDGGDVDPDTGFPTDQGHQDALTALRNAIMLQQGTGSPAAGVDALRAAAPQDPIRMPDAAATQAWRDSTPLPTGTSPDATAPTAYAPAPPAPPPDQSPQAVLNNISNGRPAQQPAPPPPAPSGGLTNPFANGLFGKSGLVSNIMHDPGRLALITAGLSAVTPAGFSGGFQQGVKLGQGEETIEQGAKRLEQEANAHQDAMTKLNAYQQAQLDKGDEGVISDDDAKFLGEQWVRTGQMPSLGYGKSASASRAKVLQAGRQYAADNNLTGADIAANRIDYAANRAGATSAARSQAGIERSTIELENVIPLGRAASDALPRSQWVPWNKAVQLWQAGKSDPRLSAFVVTTRSIVNAYAAAMGRGNGPATVHAQQEAEKLLSTVAGPEAYNAATDMMLKEAAQSRAASGQVREDIRNRVSGRAPAAPAAAPSGPVDWRTYFGAH